MVDTAKIYRGTYYNIRRSKISVHRPSPFMWDAAVRDTLHRGRVEGRRVACHPLHGYRPIRDDIRVRIRYAAAPRVKGRSVAPVTPARRAGWPTRWRTRTQTPGGWPSCSRLDTAHTTTAHNNIYIPIM